METLPEDSENPFSQTCEMISRRVLPWYSGNFLDFVTARRAGFVESISGRTFLGIPGISSSRFKGITVWIASDIRIRGIPSWHPGGIDFLGIWEFLYCELLESFPAGIRGILFWGFIEFLLSNSWNTLQEVRKISSWRFVVSVLGALFLRIHEIPTWRFVEFLSTDLFSLYPGIHSVSF